MFFGLIGLLTVIAQNATGVHTASKTILSHGKAKPMSKDTTIESNTTKENKEPQYFYFSVNTDVFVNTKGGAAKRFSPAIEFGRTYGVLISDWQPAVQFT